MNWSIAYFGLGFLNFILIINALMNNNIVCALFDGLIVIMCIVYGIKNLPKRGDK